MPTPEEIVNAAFARAGIATEPIPPVRKVSDVPVYKVTDPAIAEAIRINELRPKVLVDDKWDRIAAVLRTKGMDSRSQIDALAEIREIIEGQVVY